MAQCKSSGVVYVIKHPMTKEVVYVGITTDFISRCNKHFRNADNVNLRSFMNDLKNKNIKPLFEIVANGFFYELLILEQQLIDNYISIGYILFNQKPGRKVGFKVKNDYFTATRTA